MLMFPKVGYVVLVESESVAMEAGARHSLALPWIRD